MQNSVVAIDIGYSNLKLAFTGQDGQMNVQIYPSGSAPLSDMPKRIGGVDLRGGERVRLPNGEQWVGAVSHRAPQTTARVLSPDYPETDAYLATFLAGLLRTGLKRVAVLVTGLPVSQFYGRDGIAARRLKERLHGTHFVGDAAVTVERVFVLPQPVGAFFAASEESKLEGVQSRRFLVVDPGYFSTDYVVVDSGSVRAKSSGSSVKATSRVLENAAAAINAAGGQVSRERLEEMIRNGETIGLINGEPKDVSGYVDAAAHKVAHDVAKEVLGAMRGETDGFDQVVVGGGGAHLFAPALKRAFEGSKVVVVGEPVLANVRGYFAWGRRPARLQ